MKALTLPRLAPPLFVFLWATGFIAARLVIPYADPLTFLVLRYVIAASLLALIALAGARAVARHRPRLGRRHGRRHADPWRLSRRGVLVDQARAAGRHLGADRRF